MFLEKTHFLCVPELLRNDANFVLRMLLVFTSASKRTTSLTMCEHHTNKCENAKQVQLKSKYPTENETVCMHFTLLRLGGRLFFEF